MDAVHPRVRQAASGMIAIAERYGEHPAVSAEEMRDALSSLLNDDVPALFSAGIRTASDHPGVEYSTLYYDGLLRIVVSHLPAGFGEQTHDHGNVNQVMVLQGSLDYQQYRLIDEPHDGVARLESVFERKLERGDVGLVLPPPDDIHALTVLEDDTYVLTAMFSPSAPTRRFFDVEAGTYIEVANR